MPHTILSIIITSSVGHDSFQSLRKAITSQRNKQVLIELALALDPTDKKYYSETRPSIDPELNFRSIECDANERTYYSAGANHVKGEWLWFPSKLKSIEESHLVKIIAYLESQDNKTQILFLTPESEDSDSYVNPTLISNLLYIPNDISHCLFRRTTWLGTHFSNSKFIRESFFEKHLISQYLLSCCYGQAGYARITPALKSISVKDEADWWLLDTSYDEALQDNHVKLLSVIDNHQATPQWLQRWILSDLECYFYLEMGERAPTRIVGDELSTRFHAHLRKIFERLDESVIKSALKTPEELMILYAFLSYKSTHQHSDCYVSTYDQDKGLVRIHYFVVGEKPSETFSIDGVAIEVSHAKYRGCRLFRRILYRERIAWLPIKRKETLTIEIGGETANIFIESDAESSSEASAALNAETLRTAFPLIRRKPRPYREGIEGIKVRLTRLFADLPPYKQLYADAWVFTDREYDADDNAEHLYRWVRNNHPEINAWFLLNKDSPDWSRLSNDGFRLIPEGWRRRLLLRNCAHVISSHADYSSPHFIRSNYADIMTWKFSFLQHGVVNTDLSDWLNKQIFDRSVTTAPREFLAVVNDDSPYNHTTKETTLTGLPRHDRLLELARSIPREETKYILILPTWRASLIESESSEKPSHDALRRFSTSEYVMRWGQLMRNDRLRDLATSNSLQIAFMPHPDSVPYLTAFDIPDGIIVFTKAEIRMQELFCRTAVMISDYSSVTSEMAYIERPVIYYQFDRDAFFSKGHVWRPGYFDYERDGFGPVSVDENDVVQQIEQILRNGRYPEDKYLDRMREFFAFHDGGCCERVFDQIQSLHEPDCTQTS